MRFSVTNLCVVLCFLCVGPFARAADGLGDLLQAAEGSATQSSDSSTADKLPVPSSELRNASTAKIRDLFAKDVAKAVSPQAKSELAKELTRHASETNDATDRYVLMLAARRLAIDAGDLDLALQSTEALCRTFAMNSQAENLATLKNLASKPTAASAGRLADELVRAGSLAANTGDDETAEDLFQLAVTVLRRANDRDRQKQVTERLAVLRAKGKMTARISALEEKLAADPGNSGLCDELGRLVCFELDDWDRGLPLLAKGSDTHLARLAQMELSPSPAPLPLADAWNDYSSSARSSAGGAAAARARFHYAAALRDAQGLERVAIEKKIKELASKGGDGKRGGKPRDPRLILDVDVSILASMSDASKKKPAPGTAVVSWRDRDGLGSPLHIIATNPAPIFSQNPASGGFGLLFKGQERLEIASTAPSPGSIVVKLSVTAIANQRVFYGPGPALRSDGSIWFQSVADGSGKEILERTPPNTYKPGTPIVIGLTWPKPFFLTTSTGQSSQGQTSLDAWAPPRPWTVGGSPGAVFEPFTGQIYRILVFDSALSAQELTALCRSTIDD
jgi:hypothetical protein